MEIIKGIAMVLVASVVLGAFYQWGKSDGELEIIERHLHKGIMEFNSLLDRIERTAEKKEFEKTTKGAEEREEQPWKKNIMDRFTKME